MKASIAISQEKSMAIVEDNMKRGNDDIISKSEDNELGNTSKRFKHNDRSDPTSSITNSNTDNVTPIAKGKGKGRGKKANASDEPMSKAREIRLESNRKAARESRRRKKELQEELQRSVIFFSRANGTLKQQNEELQLMLTQARSQIEAGQAPLPQAAAAPVSTVVEEKQESPFAPAQPANNDDQQQASDANADDPNNNLGQSAPAPVMDNSNMMMNWMMFGPLMGIDPNNPYAQALGQFAMQQQQGQAPGSDGPGTRTPNPLQFPFGMPAGGMMPMQFGGANPFGQFPQFGGAPNAAAPWGALGNGMGNTAQNYFSGGAGAPANA